MNTKVERKLEIWSSQEPKEMRISRRRVSAINSAKEIKEEKEWKVSTGFSHKNFVENISKICWD